MVRVSGVSVVGKPRDFIKALVVGRQGSHVFIDFERDAGRAGAVGRAGAGGLGSGDGGQGGAQRFCVALQRAAVLPATGAPTAGGAGASRGEAAARSAHPSGGGALGAATVRNGNPTQLGGGTGEASAGGRAAHAHAERAVSVPRLDLQKLSPGPLSPRPGGSRGKAPMPSVSDVSRLSEPDLLALSRESRCARRGRTWATPGVSACPCVGSRAYICLSIDRSICLSVYRSIYLSI